MSTNTKGEGEIRKQIIENDLVDCMIALPGQLFYTTQIPVCLWFLSKSKKADKKRGYRSREGETLFIDARNMGSMVDRTHKELTKEDIQTICETYHGWRGQDVGAKYEDEAGYSKSVQLKDIEKNDFVLTPGRYVGTAPLEDDGIPIEEKIAKLVGALHRQVASSRDLNHLILDELAKMGYEK